ncbi:YdcF family protein [Spirochaetia bacterium 38H-sp]|uniref:YdcF family protein n=1 Tax=Rarispira pelagica TaxID=3141764 RepID=A0ABU9U9J3_9SPIR
MLFTLSRVISAFLLPPGIFIVLLAFYAMKEKTRGNTRTAATIGVFAIFIYLFSTPLFSNFVLSPLEPKQLLRIPSDAYCIVVLGGGSSGPVSVEQPSASSSSRLLYAAYLAKKLGLPLYITGGAVYKNSSAESLVMTEYVRNFGIKIYTEDKSKNTWENAKNMAKIIPNNSKIILITSAFHMPRAIWSFKKNGLEVIPAPCDYRIRYDLPLYMIFLPSVTSFESSSIALREYIAYLWYSLRYN